MITCEGVQLHAFSNSAPDESEWSASCPGRFTPGERATSTHWIEGWVGLRASLNAATKKILPPPRIEPLASNP
jgi:hypothetical protein